MDGAALQDRISYGLGAAARHIGVSCNAFRPVGPADPLAAGNRFLQLYAAFNARDPRFAAAGMPQDAAWYGVFDAAYLQPGDYLCEAIGGRVWFVAVLQPLLPPVCILTNRVVSLTRPAGAMAPGVNAYGGGGAPLVLAGLWPASLLHGNAARGVDVLPADTRPSGAVALLPQIAGSFLRGDLLSDDLGRTFVVSGAELNDQGWRLDLRQAAS